MAMTSVKFSRINLLHKFTRGSGRGISISSIQYQPNATVVTVRSEFCKCKCNTFLEPRKNLQPSVFDQRYFSQKMEPMERHEVVPDVLDAVPAQAAEVTWPSGVKAELGNVTTPTMMKDIPTVSWPAEEGALYTVIMTDPDAPSRKDPKYREWHHWIVVDVPGTDLGKGKTQSAYVGAGPPEGTGLHRYVVIVYKQPGPLTITEPPLPKTGDGRPKFKASEFAKKHNLGSPVAANFVQAEYDDYVPKLYAELASNK